MESLAFIREHFRPIQPSVQGEKGNVQYQEYAPHKSLRHYIHCFWELATTESLAQDFDYRVVSDGCIDVFYNVNEPCESFVMGFCDRYTEFPIGKDFCFAGVRFYPSVFPQLFNISAKSLKNQDQALASILPPLAQLIAGFTGEFRSAIPQLEQYFQSILKLSPPSIDERFRNALMLTLQQNGHLEIEREIDTGLSPRQLRRLFQYYIGTSPKSFCQVVRFQ
ncbi:MAG: DUF6597 domain-containing transcriptional factor, partial [Bacteroidota bacterium]